MLIVGDLHLTSEEKHKYRWTIFDVVSAVAQPNESIIFLGDLTEKAEGHTAVLVNRLVDRMVELSRKHQILIVRGNHDYNTTQQGSAVPFFRFLDHYEHIYSPQDVEAMFLMDDIQFSVTGYGDPIINQDAPVIFAHHAFPNSVNDNLSPAEASYEDMVDECDGTWVICGHQHRPQEIKYANGTVVTYVGSPYETRVEPLEDRVPRFLFRITAETVSSRIGEKIPVYFPGKYKVLIRSADELPKLLADAHITEGSEIVTELMVDGDDVSVTETQAQVAAMLESSGLTAGRQIVHVTPTDEIITEKPLDDDAVVRIVAEAAKVSDQIRDVGLSLLHGTLEVK